MPTAGYVKSSIWGEGDPEGSAIRLKIDERLDTPGARPSASGLAAAAIPNL